MIFGNLKKTKGNCPIGLHIGSQTVRMVQLDRAASRSDGERRGARTKADREAGGARVSAAASMRLPEGIEHQEPAVYRAAVIETVREVMASAKFQGNEVVSCLRPEWVKCKSLRMPSMPMAELRSAAEWEARDRMGLGDTDYDIQFINVGEVRQGEDVREELIVLAANQDKIRSHMDLLLGCGLDPVAIDAVPSALSRCVASLNTNDAKKVTALINVGSGSTSVLIVEGARVRFYRQIELGGSKLGNSASVDEVVVKELAREIGLCMRYYSVTFRSVRPERAYLVGGGAPNGALAAMLGRESELTLDPGVPTPRIASDSLSTFGVERESSADTHEAGFVPEGQAGGDAFGISASGISTSGISTSGISASGNSASGISASWAIALGLALRTDLRLAKRGAA